MDVQARPIHRDAENWRRIGELLADDVQVAHFVRPLCTPLHNPARLYEVYEFPKRGRFTT